MNPILYLQHKICNIHSSLVPNVPIEFLIKTADDIYIDICNLLLYTKSKILLKNNGTIFATAFGGAIPEYSYIASINYFHTTQLKS